MKQVEADFFLQNGLAINEISLTGHPNHTFFIN